MTILQEQAAMSRAIVSDDCQSTRSFRPKGGAQKGRRAVWTYEVRLKGEVHGRTESHGGAT